MNYSEDQSHIIIDTIPTLAWSGRADGAVEFFNRCWLNYTAEREHISEVLDLTNGLIAGKGGAAEVLGVAASTLRNRMKKLGIRSDRRRG